MSKHILSLLALAILSSTAQAGYTVKIPLEVAQGGALENGSIQIVDSNAGSGNGGNDGSTEPTEPTTPTEPTEPSTARKLVSVTYIVGLVNSDGLTSGYNNTNPSFSQLYNSMVAVVPYTAGLNEVVEMKSGGFSCPVSGNFELEAEKTTAIQCSSNLIPTDTPLGTSFTIDFWTK
ncbi:hypothetical protein ACCE15_19255 [Pseudomonas parafulva]|uniref:hypothetical protein n=1 Tax=Pseudomonas parafulva TaxID=157782 RepID=UPI003563A700